MDLFLRSSVIVYDKKKLNYIINFKNIFIVICPLKKYKIYT